MGTSMWHRTVLTERLNLRYPLVLAPMAGVSTPKLVAAVTNAGGMGVFGAALTPPIALPGLVQDIRSLLQRPEAPFGFNLFCPPPSIPPHSPQQQQALEAVHSYYADLAKQHSLSCNVELQPPPDLTTLKSTFEAQVEALLASQVPVLSFYFGLPEPELLSRVKASGVFTMGTATNKHEALQLQAAGIDCIVVQGSEAGGHRGTWYTTSGPYINSMVGTITLVGLLSRHIKGTPLLATGGIMSGQQVVAALAAGAAGAQVGTAFLTCHEAGTAQLARKVLLSDHERGTTVTQAFTGKPARGLINKPSVDLEQLQAQLPTTAYGLVNARPFYAAAVQAGLEDYIMQLCGQGYPSCREGSASELMAALVQEAEEAVQQITTGSAASS